ncbi:DUF6049 family protein [Modestobacter sp. Leaf380]|uniref:DUF6049 family protein n=1 Tax=Modestobacter sp. Leaf380 TaxID=1736356 RepID=UPI0006FAD6A8|nr:DUF6049 family protein [Modestobacter sp. Leaf380]KQS66838.1 hypothetical protein ASG41_10535 [Modestobacter sp. Leaf380]
MRRRAAGGAGRPAVATRVWVLLATALVSLLAVPALATPASAAPDPGSSAAPTSAGDRPVRVVVDTFEPRTLVLGGTVAVSGTLVNDSDDTITDLSVRLQRGDRLSTRAELAADVAAPSTGSAVQAPFLPVDGVLDPGDDLRFTYTATTDELGLTADGVYPVLLNVNGSRDGLVERIGELSTHLLVQPAVPTSRTTVAWLWPLTDRPHRDASGAFTDDELADDVSAGGRLDRALDVLEELPDGGVAVPVTLVVDPALVEELRAMAGGYTVDGVAGSGTAAATDWLDRLRALAAVHPVAALPYADVDADALQAAGLADVLTRSLPGTAEGTAAQPTDADGDPAVTPAPGAPPRTEPAGDTGAGARILADTLDVEPATDLAWPTGGTVRADTLATLRAGGADRVVLAAGAYSDPGAALGSTGGTAAARVPLETADGETTTLVADGTLSAVVASAATAAAGPRVVEQRYLAELGVLTSQLAAVDPAVAQTVLVVPPREVDADPSWATPMIADTVTQPWLAAASVEDLAEGPEADAGELVEPTGDRQLALAGMAEIAGSVAVRDDVATAVVSDPATVLAGYDAAIARASSSGWLGDPEGFATAATDLDRTVAALRGQVTLLAPADGAYSLASSDAPLVLTVRNDLPFAVSAQLALSSRGGLGFSSDPVPATVLEPGSRTTITVPTQVRQSGSFTVAAMLSTPSGGPLGEPVQLRVTSTAYGPITLAITIGAAALLGLLFLRRLVLFVLRRRRGEPTAADEDVLVPVDAEMPDGDPAPRPRDAGPPTRSRV